MAKITSRQSFSDWCLRANGAPVVNVEIDDAQLEDAIENSISYFIENHFDGIVRDFMVHKVTGSVITLDTTPSVVKGDTIRLSDNSCQAKIALVNGDQFTIQRQIGFVKFAIGQTLYSSTGTAIGNILNISLGDMDNGYFTIDENIVGVNQILNITSVLGSSDYMFNMQYQIMKTELDALTKAGASMYWQTLNYLGHLDFIMKKEKNFTFHRRMNRLMMEISWATDVQVGDFIAAEVYRGVDPDTYVNVYNDRWLQRYSAAMVKKYQGTNLKKYSGVQLPGGMTYNGQQIYNEAIQEIKELEDEALTMSAPLAFMIG